MIVEANNMSHADSCSVPAAVHILHLHVDDRSSCQELDLFAVMHCKLSFHRQVCGDTVWTLQACLCI